MEAQVRSDAPTKDEEYDTIDEQAQKLTKQLLENMNDVLEMNLLQFGNKFDLKARHFMEELEGVIRGNSNRVISYLGGESIDLIIDEDMRQLWKLQVRLVSRVTL